MVGLISLKGRAFVVGSISFPLSSLLSYFPFFDLCHPQSSSTAAILCPPWSCICSGFFFIAVLSSLSWLSSASPSSRVSSYRYSSPIFLSPPRSLHSSSSAGVFFLELYFFHFTMNFRNCPRPKEIRYVVKINL